MNIGNELAAFLTSPVLIIVGTCDPDGRPDIGRAVGARVERSSGVVELVLSAWQWPGTAANLHATGRAAVTFSRPSDYVSYQLKGRADVRKADAQALALSARYIEDIATVLGGLGLERRIIASLLTHRDAFVVRVEVDETFVQTPGAKAGQPLAARAG